MKLEYFDIKLDNLPMNQFIKKYELLIPQQKRAYNKELPENGEYLEDGDGEGVLFSDEPIKRDYNDTTLVDFQETIEELIIEHLIPNTLEEEKEVIRHCNNVFDKTLTSAQRSKIFEYEWNAGLITFEEDEYHDTKEDYIHEYYY